MGDQKQMSQADREAWLSMAGDDFLPWLQQEVGVAMAKLGLRDNLKDFMSRLDKLEETGISEHVALESMKRTADGLGALAHTMQSVLTLLRKMEERMSQHEIATPPQAPEPEKVKPTAPVLSPTLQRVYDYIVKNQGKTQSELGYILDHSKTALSGMLAELSRMGLVTHDKARTANGGMTFLYFPTEGRKGVPTRADNTFLAKVVDACGKLPWSTAGELVDKVDWGGKAPTVRVMSATLSNAVSHGMLRSYRKSGDLTRYALPDVALPMAHTDSLYKDVHGGPRAAAPAPVAPPAAPERRAHSLHEQLVIKVLTGADRFLSVPWITDKINTDFGTEVLNNSVNSVCIRLEKRGLLISEPLHTGSHRRRYALVGQATST